MFEFFWHLGSFILALGILVTVHEYGHFWVARKAGVKVLRFSIGFGKPLIRWYDKLGTEYVIALIPLGGYVKMLDERADIVSENERHLSFNSKSVWARIAIVSAGPAANFIFAIFVLALMYMIGVQNAKPVVGDIHPLSRASSAHIQAGDHIISMDGSDVFSWQDVTFSLMSNLGESSTELKVKDAQGQLKTRTIDLKGWKLDKQDQPPIDSIGIIPFRPALTLTIGRVERGSAADKSGLQVGDKLLKANGKTIENWQSLVNLVQNSANQNMLIEIQREGHVKAFTVTPGIKNGPNNEQLGFLGVVPQLESWPPNYIETRHYGPLDSIVLGVQKTYALITLSFDMIGNLITGQISVKNLSGPVGIAVGAGTSVSYGLVAFLSFLALISVNLGVFNLLPLPVLDGGHLMYYIIELIRKKPVSEKTQELGYKVGAMLLLGLTCFALLNDVSRL